MSQEHGSARAEPGIGRRLEEAREKRGMSFAQVEESTKIRARYLRELERENFDVLPAVYVLGSLKTYADFLGLDGAVLSRELRELLAPEEPEVAGVADPREPEEAYEAAPAVAVGFNQLFLGMGVLIVSVLAIMTLVSAVAQNAGPTKVSQVDEPSVQDAPEEMDLAGNVNSGRDPQPRNAGEAGKNDTEQEAKEGRDDKPGPPKDGVGRENEKGEEASPPETLYGDVEFVPMSPAGSSEASAPASASASATAAPASPAPDSAPKNAASPSTSTEPSEADASAVPSNRAVNAVPAGDDGDLRRPGSGAGRDREPARKMDADKMSARIAADVEGDLREDGVGW